MPLSRSTPLRRSTPLPRGTGPSRKARIKQANPERQQRKRRDYARKLAAMKRGEGYKAAMARAGGQCENRLWTIGPEPMEVWRCDATTRLHAHHLTYARLGGDELPSDLLIVCKDCHAWIESTQHPHRRNGRAV